MEARYAGVELNELRELRQLRKEKRKLKRVVTDHTLDKHIWQEVFSYHDFPTFGLKSNVSKDRSPLRSFTGP